MSSRLQRLIWKDYRVTRLLGILLILATALSVYFSGGYPMLHGWQPVNIMVYVPVFLAFLVSVVSATDETIINGSSVPCIITGNPPIAIIAHIIVGIAYSFISAMAGYIVLICTCPSEYRLLSSSQHGLGGWITICIMLMCSSYIGVCSGLLMRRYEPLGKIWGWLAILLVYLYVTYPSICANMGYYRYLATTVFMVPVFIVLITLRSHSSGTRLYAFVAMAVLLGLGCIKTAMVMSDLHSTYNTTNETNRVSPTGRYTIRSSVATRSFGIETTHSTTIYDQVTQKRLAVIPNTDILDRPTWISPRCVLIASELNRSTSLIVVNIHDYTTDVDVLPLDHQDCDIYGSPDKRYALVRHAAHSSAPPYDTNSCDFVVLDVRHAKWLTQPIYVRTCWWQSDTSVGYIDTAGKRRILVLAGGKGQ